MQNKINASTHLKSVTFEIRYPASPFYPREPVLAQFSGVLNADDRVYVKLDSGSIPDTFSVPGIPITGTFTIEPNEDPSSFSGFLCNHKIEADAKQS